MRIEDKIRKIIEKHTHGNYLLDEAVREGIILDLIDMLDSDFDFDASREQDYDICHLINDTYQVTGRRTGTVFLQGSFSECNEWVSL